MPFDGPGRLNRLGISLAAKWWWHERSTHWHASSTFASPSPRGVLLRRVEHKGASGGLYTLLRKATGNSPLNLSHERASTAVI